MKNLVLFFLSVLHLYMSCQNLIPNAGFETYTACPTNPGQVSSANPWFSPTIGTPDYFNQCATATTVKVPKNVLGYQPAHGGYGYAGLIQYTQSLSNNREYIEVPLTQSLNAGNCYYFELYFSSADAYGLVSPDLQVYLSDTIKSAIAHSKVLSFIPQISNSVTNMPDTLNWTKMSSNYTAHGGEKYLLIGNFRNDTNTTIVNMNPNSNVKAAYVYIDDLKLTACSFVGMKENANNNRLVIFPQPFRDVITVRMNIPGDYEVMVYDGFGRTVTKEKFSVEKTITTSFPGPGVYYYRLFREGVCTDFGKLIKE